MMYGLLGLSIKGYLLATFILTQITIAGVTIYLHRYQTHMALKLHPIMSHFFRFWLWMTTGIMTKEWVAIHRKHHAKCETKDDPHSPKNWGLKNMLLRGAEIYRVGKTPETVALFGHGTPNDWLEKNIYSRYHKLGIGMMLIIDCILFGLPGLSIWAIQMMWIPFWAGGVVNGIGHSYGYRNFEPEDASTNIFPLALFIGGEELHNNHHTFPSSAKLSVKWWEVDIGWLYIQILQLLGLATVKRTRPRLSIKPERAAMDLTVAKTISAHRLQVMEDYSHKVIIPTIKMERSNTKSAISSKAKKLLICSNYLLDNQNKKVILELLNSHKGLNVVYRFKESLQHIWDTHKNNQQELVTALKQWMTDAQTSGNTLLEKFATNMPQYVVK